MIPSPSRRAPHQGNQGFHPAPNAALLIDFDNVTMGIRSDLGKELKSLLNSEVIRGKVAVQRAYADWRRYPQYIVPLAESSIDLIFAPAYGSSKKNATDLRMAIDAMELVFTRPEIGTFILMTGDSDFSSCVLKLKEYGKYVIGVGMRESSSDLLIQNCDEYYSYHSLSGLTRAGDVEESKEDPWTLVKRAVQQMITNNDVMRTDRLKQVMLGLDPAFDEKKIGYSKFSRFVSEASNKGLLRLRKGENGQYEIAVDGDSGAAGRTSARTESARTESAAAPAAAAAEAPQESSSRSRRGRPSRRDESRRTQEAEKPAAPEPKAAAPEPQRPAAPAPSAPAPAVGKVADVDEAYRLLQQAVRSLGGSERKPIRDGDVKRKMMDIVPSFDETDLGFSKFTRFLRQAHDAEVIDLNRVNGGNYEVTLSASGKRLEPLAAAPAQAEAAAPAAPAAEERPAAQAAAPAEAPAAKKPEAAPPSRTTAAPGALRGRRTGRAGAPEGPPPLLPGQVVRLSEVEAAEAKPAESAAPAAEAEAAGAAPAKKASRRGRRGGSKRAATETAEAPAAEAPAAPEAPAAEPAEEAPRKSSRSRGRKQPAKKSAAAAPSTPPAREAAVATPASGFSASALNLPRGRQSVEAYLTNSYRGVGAKTAEALWKEYGPELFATLQNEPDRVRKLLGAGRANSLLEQWSEDYGRRTESEAESTPAAEAPQEEPQAEAESAPAKKTRRGGRGRSRKKAATSVE